MEMRLSGQDGRLRTDHTLESEEPGAITIEKLKSLRGREFLERSIEYFRNVIETSYSQVGYNLAGYSPEKLRVIDSDVTGSAKEACAREGVPAEPGILWSAYHGIGSYFGTVIVHNLGGHWRTPSTVRFQLSQMLGRPGILFDHWYVELNGKRIPVFKIARWRCDGSGRVKSLAEVYERIASGRSWRD
ncbi:MAG: hypothetical protein WAS24_08335 [Thermoplasmata archaeon]